MPHSDQYYVDLAVARAKANSLADAALLKRLSFRQRVDGFKDYNVFLDGNWIGHVYQDACNFRWWHNSVLYSDSFDLRREAALELAKRSLIPVLIP